MPLLRKKDEIYKRIQRFHQQSGQEFRLKLIRRQEKNEIHDLRETERLFDRG